MKVIKSQTISYVRCVSMVLTVSKGYKAIKKLDTHIERFYFLPNEIG